MTHISIPNTSATGWTGNAFLAVNRVRVTFGCSLGGADKTAMGTGFWIRDGEEHYFATNKHNVDPTLKLGPNTTYSLRTIAIELRRVVDMAEGERYTDQTRFFDVPRRRVAAHATADCAIVRWPHGSRHSDHGLTSFGVADIADAKFFEEHVNPMDLVSFIGFPGRKEEWWDTEANFPIARNANIASIPSKDFSNPIIKTTNTLLVSGFSFSGSSGSPVCLHSKGLNIVLPGVGSGSNYVPPKILGIMSGHWYEDGGPDMFQHSGLSYFTKSTALLETISIATF